MSCIAQDADYGAVSERLRAKATAGRIPVSGSFELTERCNLSCAHCYINRPVDDATALAEEMTRDEVFAIFDKLAHAGCLWLAFTGGEPMVRPDFADIYSRARELGFLVSVFTNATLVTPRIVALFTRMPPFTVEVTVYGITRATCERVTGAPGSFDRCMDGVRRLADAGVRLELKTTVSVLNQGDLGAIRQLAADLGALFRFELLLNNRLDGTRQGGRVALSPREIAEIDLADGRVREIRLAAANRPRDTGPGSNLYTCSAGIRAFHVDARGRLMPCIMVRRPAFDLLAGSFADGFDGPIRDAVRAVRTAQAPCAGCEVASVCDACPGWGLIEKGDPEAAVDFLCEVARERGRMLGLAGSDRRVP
ncbi:MAG: radical SAM protein [Deltaproteobacteria bacterium]|nr:radical SAM protein [Deltaproteobacteria bacterium]